MISMRFLRPTTVAATVAVAGLMQGFAPVSAQAAAPETGQTLASANAARARHGAGPLAWSDAQYPGALQHASACRFAHSNTGGRYGETLHLVPGSPSTGSAIQSAVDAWMSQAAGYDYNNPHNSPTTEAFTQLVWRSTTQIAVAVARCAPGTIRPEATTFVVARYTPPGNYQGQFAQNVGRPGA